MNTTTTPRRNVARITATVLAFGAIGAAGAAIDTSTLRADRDASRTAAVTAPSTSTTDPYRSRSVPVATTTPNPYRRLVPVAASTPDPYRRTVPIATTAPYRASAPTPYRATAPTMVPVRSTWSVAPSRSTWS